MGVLIFFIGAVCGALLGTVLMCCLQIGRVNEYRREISKLRNICK